MCTKLFSRDNACNVDQTNSILHLQQAKAAAKSASENPAKAEASATSDQAPEWLSHKAVLERKGSQSAQAKLGNDLAAALGRLRGIIRPTEDACDGGSPHRSWLVPFEQHQLAPTSSLNGSTSKTYSAASAAELNDSLPLVWCAGAMHRRHQPLCLPIRMARNFQSTLTYHRIRMPCNRPMFGPQLGKAHTLERRYHDY